MRVWLQKTRESPLRRIVAKGLHSQREHQRQADEVPYRKSPRLNHDIWEVENGQTRSWLPSN